MTKSPTLSVIIPVYNSERFLYKCLDSVVNQTYKNLEIILIDDGSTDSSSSICMNYAEIHSNITYIRSLNGGPSKSRNIGLEVSSGEYITFVDSDDYLELDIYQKVIDSFRDDIDIVSFGVRTLNVNNKILSEYSEIDTIYGSEDVVKEIVAKLKTAVWNKVFRRRSINNIMFPNEFMHNEDMIFLCRCISNNIRFRTIPSIGYNYVKHGSSVTSRPFTDKSFDEIKAKDLAFDIISQKFPNLSDIILPLKITGRLNVLRGISRSNNEKFNGEKRTIKKWLRRNVRISDLSWKLKVKYAFTMNDWLIKLLK